jgi:5'-deoxynucleotidase YfbR-like HD superfamily hydrolase
MVQAEKIMLKQIIIARRAGNVTRYHTSQLLQKETVAQHTFNMINILMVVTDRQITANLLMAVVTHDMGEYKTGDIPSPVKKLSPEFREHCNAIEDKAMREVHVGFFPELTEWEYRLLKFADNLDGLMKITEERRMGNKLEDTRIIGENYASYISSMPDLGPTMLALFDEAQKEFIES